MIEIIIVIAFVAIYLLTVFIIRSITCSQCPYKDECKKSLEKGDIPPCTKTSMLNPFNNNIASGV